MSVKADLVHSVPGRLRLKIADKRGDAGYFEDLCARLGELEGVVGVTANAATGSLLVLHDWQSEEALVRLGQASERFVLRPAAFEPIWQRTAAGLDQAHARLMRFTRGELGVRSALLLSLVLLSLRQAARGQVLGPASSLLWSALSLVGVPEERPVGLRVRRADGALRH